jgi:para-nitrobenzyl esterase
MFEAHETFSGPMIDGRLRPAPDEKLAQKIHAYWVQFAKTGDPNQTGLPNWPRYSSDKEELMNFTADGPVAQPDTWKAGST